MRAVVLAAGDGGRLGAYTERLPKALVPVAGRPIIQYTLESLAEAGVDEAVVVTGHRERQLLAALFEAPGVPRLRFVSNPEFRRGASFSLQAARPAVDGERFLLVMADHLLSVEAIRRLLDPGQPGASLVAADFTPEPHHDLHEATRLRVDAHGKPGESRMVTAIGKHIAPYDALDAGAFLLDRGVWDAAASVDPDCELSVIFGALIRRGELFAADISGAFWFDVDTEQDLAAAEELVRRRSKRGVA
jgi:1L-myo-inositol 1-phosphate cytidylyltransferase/CDP-L-myo-inositol myo-inositolphosphotransferase